MSQATDPYVADLLGIADKRVEELKVQLDSEEKEKDNLEKRNKGLRKQVYIHISCCSCKSIITRVSTGICGRH